MCSDRMSTPSTATALQPAPAILAALSAMSRGSPMWMCGHTVAADAKTACTCAVVNYLLLIRCIHSWQLCVHEFT